MPLMEQELDELRKISPEAAIYSEGGKDYVLMPYVRVPDPSSALVTDLLFCPTEREGYPSRLFFAQQVPSKTARPWTSFRIIGREWWAYSWRVEAGTNSLLQLIGIHMGALR